MSKKDLEELLRRLAYAAYKVRRNYPASSLNDLRFRLTDYRTSCNHQKLMRRERRWSVEVDQRIKEINRVKG